MDHCGMLPGHTLAASGHSSEVPQSVHSGELYWISYYCGEFVGSLIMCVCVHVYVCMCACMCVCVCACVCQVVSL